jgi:hypothetical protein
VRREGWREVERVSDVVHKIDPRLGVEDVEDDLSLSLQTGAHQRSSAILDRDTRPQTEEAKDEERQRRRGGAPHRRR